MTRTIPSPCYESTSVPSSSLTTVFLFSSPYRAAPWLHCSPCLQYVTNEFECNSPHLYAAASSNPVDLSSNELVTTKCNSNSPYNSFASSRRNFLSLITIGTSLTSPLSLSVYSSYKCNGSLFQQLRQPSMVTPSLGLASAEAAETIGKDVSCNDASCLGVWDGLLADCPHDKLGSNSLLSPIKSGAGCVSSQDDTPGVFAEPWDYSENLPLGTTLATAETQNDDVDQKMYQNQMNQLILALDTTSRQHGDDMQILFQEGRYIRVLFIDGSSGEKSVGEFYFTPHDTTVQFRLGSIAYGGDSSVFGRSLSNMERSERLRKTLRYLKVPVLRNRKRALFFIESELDGFGPGSAALGPPEEMSIRELVGK